MIQKKIFLNESVDETGLFDEYCCISKYIEGKCEIWNEKLTEYELWQEIFWHFKQEGIPLKNISSHKIFLICARNKCSCGKSVFTGECLMGR
jgi:hypothetical protein